MSSISKIAGLSALFLIGIFAAQNEPCVSAATFIQEYGCCNTGCVDPGCGVCGTNRVANCRKCRGKKRGCRKCPKCQMEFCELEVKQTESKETCYKTEQKIVCIPRVQMPWQKCCPPQTSKTRTVNVLKTHSYKCPSCEYNWTLHEPEIPEANGNARQSSENGQAIQVMPVSNQPMYESVPTAPPFEHTIGDTPAPPTSTYDPSVPVRSR